MDNGGKCSLNYEAVGSIVFTVLPVCDVYVDGVCLLFMKVETDCVWKKANFCINILKYCYSELYYIIFGRVLSHFHHLNIQFPMVKYSYT